MIKVMGASPEKIDLPEIDDRIYYKQEKIFSELQYKRSHTLRHAIDLGSIIILERSPENKELGAPPVSDIHIPVASPSKPKEYRTPTFTEEHKKESSDFLAEGDKLDLVLKKIASLESQINNESEKKSVDYDPINIILDRLKKLEDSMSGAMPGSVDNSEVMQSLKAIENKINVGQGINTEDLIKKLEETVARSGGAQSVTKTATSGPDMETYVPNVTVEDANSHINLKVRTVEKSDGVNSALDALKKLKGKSK